MFQLQLHHNHNLPDDCYRELKMYSDQIIVEELPSQSDIHTGGNNLFSFQDYKSELEAIHYLTSSVGVKTC